MTTVLTTRQNNNNNRNDNVRSPGTNLRPELIITRNNRRDSVRETGRRGRTACDVPVVPTPVNYIIARHNVAGRTHETAARPRTVVIVFSFFHIFCFSLSLSLTPDLLLVARFRDVLAYTRRHWVLRDQFKKEPGFYF